MQVRNSLNLSSLPVYVFGHTLQQNMITDGDGKAAEPDRTRPAAS